MYLYLSACQPRKVVIVNVFMFKFCKVMTLIDEEEPLSLLFNEAEGKASVQTFCASCKVNIMMMFADSSKFEFGASPQLVRYCLLLKRKSSDK